jgi:leucyl/phenylalanyl-tRNA--protein transferase
MIPWLEPGDELPPVERALREPNGLLAAGGDLSPQRLLEAYRQGVFPWFSSDDPLLWWSPDPRMVLFVREVRVSRSLRRTIRSRRFRVTADVAFGDVIAGCGAPSVNRESTWITHEMEQAYRRLASLGWAHSAEAWAGSELAGGLYGVAVGRMFYGESMFTRQRDASKVVLVHLARQLERWGFELIDCQMSTPHLASLGAREIPRSDFVQRLKRLVDQPPVASPWALDEDLWETV